MFTKDILKNYSLIETPDWKFLRGPEINYNFSKVTGYTETWGKTKEENPSFSPVSCLIADIEISFGAGCPMTCKFCYKGNSKGNKAINMSLDTFKAIFEKFPRIGKSYILHQIALGITSLSSSPDFFSICDYIRDNGVIPNVTLNGADNISDNEVSRLVKTLGAMAISINKYNCQSGFNLIERLVNAGGKQINIHYVVSKQSIDFAYELLNNIKSNPKLKGLNAIVFLNLKPKNRGQNLDLLPEEEHKKLIRYCLNNNIRWGHDSCGAAKVLRAFNKEEYQKYESVVEKCESTKESFYCNAEGKFFPCSFLEGENRDIWENGINMLSVNDFLEEVWYHPSTVAFRNAVNEENGKECGNCCHFKI